VVDGIASPQPPSVPPDFWCPSVVGPSVWNTSLIPETSPAPDLGLASFWTGALLNGSDFVLVVSVADGTVDLAGPLPVSDCTGAFAAGVDSDTRLPTVLADSRQIATEARSLKQFGPFVNSHSSYAAIYNLGGWPLVAGLASSGASWSLQLQTCGVPDTSNVSDYALQTFNISTGTPFPLGGFSGTFGCAYQAYQLNYSEPQYTANASSGTYWATFQLSATAANTTNLTLGLTTWMFGLDLTLSNGTQASTATPRCPADATSIRWCTAPPAGWYAVVSISGGPVQNEWGLFAGSDGWLHSNGLLYGNSARYWITIISRSSLVGAGDLLSAYPLTTYVNVDGTVSF
jgi:hypothetical protein